MATDWISEPRIALCSPATRAILMDMICAMHSQGGTGVISGNIVCRCSISELDTAIAEMIANGTSEISFDNDIITICWSPMRKDYLRSQTPYLRSWISANWKKVFALLSKQNGAKCQFCSALTDLQIDHKKPLARGGNNHIKNLQILCASCNQKKGAKYA